jgi:hypothetical protein
VDHKEKLVKFTEQAVINAPVEEVDLERWLFTLSDTDSVVAANTPAPGARARGRMGVRRGRDLAARIRDRSGGRFGYKHNAIWPRRPASISWIIGIIHEKWMALGSRGSRVCDSRRRRHRLT